MKEPQFISKAGLIGKRNWTENLVKVFMPHPDKEAENPHYKSAPPMKLYSLDRVERIEQTERFKEAYRSASRNKAAGKEAAETKRNKLMNYVQTVVINIPVLEKDSLIFQACASYNHHNSYRRQYVEGGEDFEPATPNSDHGFLQRITTNYIRHQLTNYHRHLDTTFGKTGNEAAYDILKARVNEEILKTYPYLNPEKELYEQSNNIILYICSMEKICGIYKIVSPTNRIYIGQSINILERFRSYKNSECKNQHKLKNSFLKHGIQKHSFEILERCNRDQLNEKEKYYISLFQSFNSKNGLNICSGGNTVMSMRTHTNATKEKIRIKKIGRKHSAETKQKMSVSRKKWKHSDKSKKKMSEIALGKNTWSKGRKMSREFKQKIKDSWVIRKQLKK